MAPFGTAQRALCHPVKLVYLTEHNTDHWKHLNRQTERDVALTKLHGMNRLTHQTKFT